MADAAPALVWFEAVVTTTTRVSGYARTSDAHPLPEGMRGKSEVKAWAERVAAAAVVGGAVVNEIAVVEARDVRVTAVWPRSEPETAVVWSVPIALRPGEVGYTDINAEDAEKARVRVIQLREEGRPPKVDFWEKTPADRNDIRIKPAKSWKPLEGIVANA